MGRAENGLHYFCFKSFSLLLNFNRSESAIMGQSVGRECYFSSRELHLINRLVETFEVGHGGLPEAHFLMLQLINTYNALSLISILNGLLSPRSFLTSIFYDFLPGFQGNKIMASFQKDLPDLSPSKRLIMDRLFHNQPVPTLTKSQSVEFVPFHQERDSMGRLISNSKSRKRFSLGSALVESVTFHNPRDHIENEDRKNQVMNVFFKKIDLESREELRSSFSPKKSKTIIHHKEFLRPIEHYDITSSLTHIKQNKSIIFRPISPEKPTHSPTLQSRRSIINQHKQEKSRVVRSLPQKEIKKAEKSLLSSLKVRISADNPEVRRHQQRQAMSLKVFTDYEEGHQRFKQKMKESKRIAHRIKKQLQLD